MRLILILFLILSPSINAKETFTKEHITKYLSLDNPFVYSAIAETYIYKEKEIYQLGNFDTILRGKYDKKDYPLTEGEFISAGIAKPLENGMELSVDYRKATGTQEYNNIKTGDEGEVLVGVKIPVLSVINNINEKKLNLDTARLDTHQANYKANNNIRLLYSQIVSHYYKLIHHNQSNSLMIELLNNAKKRVFIIRKRVEVGSLPKLSLLEGQQQIINRKQLLLSSQNRYTNTLETFLQYLDINKEQFNTLYTLPQLSDITYHSLPFSLALEEALENRPDLKVYNNEIEKLNLENKLVDVSKYPVFDVGLYGVRDLQVEENGYKVSLDINFPIQRKKYTSKSLEIKKSILNINKQKEKKISIIKTNLKTIHNSINMLLENIKNSTLEVELVKELEIAENKKYKLGLSNLFVLNQREIYTLHVKEKLLQYNLDHLLLEQERDKVVGKSINILTNTNRF